MSNFKFVRSTHKNGRFRPFPTEAYQFWLEHGWIVGEVLRQEQGLSFSEILQACQELVDEHPKSEPLPFDKKHVAWCLVKLLELGMATIVQSDPQVTTKN